MNYLIKKIHDARYQLFMKEPFFGYILQHIEVLIQEDIETAQTNGKVIIFGKQFLSDLSETDTIFILGHELLHIILNHIQRQENLDSMKYNIACDIVVNEILSYYGFKPENIHPVYGERFQIKGFQNTVEKVYSMLPIKVYETLIDSHHLWNSTTTNNLDKVIIDAKNKGYTLRGPIMTRIINSAINNISRINWKKVLEKHISKITNDYTFQKIDSRFQDVILPNYTELYESLEKVWFVIDVSGSVDDLVLSNFYSEVLHIMSKYTSVKCDVSFFSLDTTTPLQVRNTKELLESKGHIKTRGGTDFHQIFESLNKYYPVHKPKLVIILTDGYASYPRVNPCANIPIIWAIYKNKSVAPFGKTIHI